MLKLAGLFLSSAMLATTASAQTYLDDRSTPESLIHSLYNAINKRDYARAYDYFASPPAKSFADYEKGFENTFEVKVLLGTAVSEGAAGSIYHHVPIAIRATDKNSKETYFSGCYVVREFSDAIQDPPFKPMRIESAILKPSKKEDYSSYGLPKCGEGIETGDPDSTKDITPEDVIDQFASEMGDKCPLARELVAGAIEPETHAIQYRPKWASADEPEKRATLYGMPCLMGAYQGATVYYLDTHSDENPQRLSFAEPQMDFTYVDQDGEHAKLKSIVMSGFTATDQLVSPEYDATTKSISNFSKWRGIADAASNGTWVFEDGVFILRDYDVDPTYDGEMNPISVMKGGKLLPLP